MSDGSELFDEEPISAPVDETDVTAEAQSAPDDLSGLDSPVDQGSQTQPSDAVPTQTEYAAPEQRQIDPQTLGELRFLGVDPSQIPAHMTPESVVAYGRQRMQEVSQRAAQAERYESELRYLRSQQAAAQAVPHAQGSAAAATPEPEKFDFRKVVGEALNPPAPPAYAKSLFAAGHVVQGPTGKIIATETGRNLVSNEELAEINKWAEAVESHEAKRIEAFEKAVDTRFEERLAAREKERETEQAIRNFADQVKHLAEDQYGNPTPYGRALVQNVIALKDSGLSRDAKAQHAHYMTLGQAFENYQRQQALSQHYAQQYGQPPQTQTYSQPQQQFAQQPTAPQAPQPQPHTPNFLDVASHSANGSPFGAAEKDDWQPKHLGDLKARTFGQAARQLAGS